MRKNAKKDQTEWKQKLIREFDIPADIIERLSGNDYGMNFEHLYLRLRLLANDNYMSANLRAIPDPRDILVFTILGANQRSNHYETALSESTQRKPDNYGNTPSHYFALRGDGSSIRFLVESKGHDLQALNRNGTSIFHYAVLGRKLARKGIDNFQTQRALVECVDYTEDGKTQVRSTRPMIAAAFEYILASDPYAAKKGTNQFLSLNFAALAGDHSTVLFLIKEKGFPINLSDFSGRGVLHDAAQSGDIPTMRCLIELGCNPVEKPYLELTVEREVAMVDLIPAYQAALFGHTAAVKFLVENYHADLLEAGTWERELLYYAQKSGNQECISYCQSFVVEAAKEPVNKVQGKMAAAVGLFKPVVAALPPQAGLNNNNNAVPKEAPSPYPRKLQQFIDGIKAEKKPYRETLAKLGVEVRDEFCCQISFCAPDIPVKLDGRLYDLNELVNLSTDEEGKRKNPCSPDEKFDLTEIQPDRNLRDIFVAEIKKAEQEKATQEQQASPRGPSQ